MTEPDRETAFGSAPALPVGKSNPASGAPPGHSRTFAEISYGPPSIKKFDEVWLYDDERNVSRLYKCCAMAMEA